MTMLLPGTHFRPPTRDEHRQRERINHKRYVAQLSRTDPDWLVWDTQSSVGRRLMARCRQETDAKKIEEALNLAEAGDGF